MQFIKKCIAHFSTFLMHCAIFQRSTYSLCNAPFYILPGYYYFADIPDSQHATVYPGHRKIQCSALLMHFYSFLWNVCVFVCFLHSVQKMHA